MASPIPQFVGTTGSYTLTPSLAGYSFTPSQASETISGGNITGVDFTATSDKKARGTRSK